MGYYGAGFDSSIKLLYFDYFFVFFSDDQTPIGNTLSNRNNVFDFKVIYNSTQSLNTKCYINIQCKLLFDIIYSSHI